jgi:hypothetical protein
MQKLQPFIDSLQSFAQKRLKFDRPPKLFFKQDEENSKDVFGKTAHYDPREESITIFISNRHSKDVLRSLAHELVHHMQNLRGDLSPEKCGGMEMGYTQNNDHMREMEREAYEQGNLCFRDWEDGCKKQMQEIKKIKENRNMSIKISKNELKGLIGRILPKRAVSENIDAESREADSLIQDILERVTNRLKQQIKEEEKATDTEAKDAIEQVRKSKVFDDNKDAGSDKPAAAKKKPKKAHAKAAAGESKGRKGNANYAQPRRTHTKRYSPEFRTPEIEQELYENRFGARNTRLFEKLLDKWSK